MLHEVLHRSLPRSLHRNPRVEAGMDAMNGCLLLDVGGCHFLFKKSSASMLVEPRSKFGQRSAGGNLT